MKEVRKPAEQIPSSRDDLSLLKTIVRFYSNHDQSFYAFERFAGALFQLMEPNVTSIDLTRPWRDGGRDALGFYRIGNEPAGNPSGRVRTVW